MSQPPNGISFGSAIFPQLTCVPNRHTDMQTMLQSTTVAIVRMYALLAHDVMW